MDQIHTVLRSIIPDTLRILFAGFPFIIYYARRFFMNHRHKGGFFCDDKTLMLPYKGQTISSAEVLLHTTLVPIGLFIVVEHVLYRQKAFVRAYRHGINFGIGYLVAVSLMWLPKFFDGAGGLRPHFFDLCQPVMNDGTTCADAVNQGRFIEDYSCSRADFPQRIYRTFPSGHSTVSTFSVIYSLYFLEKMIIQPKLQFLKQAVQYFFLLYGFFCPVSRLFDNQHHVADVLVGTFIGALAAILVLKFVVKDLSPPVDEKRKGR